MYMYNNYVGPSAAPPLGVLSTTSTSALLIWHDLPCFRKNGRIMFYKIHVEAVENSGNESPQYSWLSTVSAEETLHRLLDLTPETTYVVQIAAKNEVGVGPWSNSVTFRTAKRT